MPPVNPLLPPFIKGGRTFVKGGIQGRFRRKK